MSTPDMVRSATPFGRPIWRLLLTAMLGLAIASRLALGAVVSTGTAADAATTGSAAARLQSVMVMCGGGPENQQPTPPPHKASFDDLLLFEQGDNLHALPGSPVPLPLADTAWTAANFKPVSWPDPPKLSRPAWLARGPPIVL